jgi:hypothetical protein
MNAILALIGSKNGDILLFRIGLVHDYVLVSTEHRRLLLLTFLIDAGGSAPPVSRPLSLEFPPSAYAISNFRSQISNRLEPYLPLGSRLRGGVERAPWGAQRGTPHRAGCVCGISNGRSNISNDLTLRFSTGWPDWSPSARFNEHRPLISLACRVGRAKETNGLARQLRPTRPGLKRRQPGDSGLPRLHLHHASPYNAQFLTPWLSFLFLFFSQAARGEISTGMRIEFSKGDRASSRMLKTTSRVVLGSPTSSTYPIGYASGVSLPAA